MSTRNWLKFIILGALWGSVFLWIKIAQQELGSLTIVAFRVLIALAGFAVIFIVRKRRLPLRQHWKLFLALSLLNIVLPFSLISWSQQHISSGMSSILNSTSTLFTLMLAHWFVPDDRLTVPKVIGLVLGFGGVVVLMSNQVHSSQGQTLAGQAAMLTAALCYSFGTIYARRKAHNIAPEVIAMGQAVFGGLLVVPPGDERRSPVPNTSSAAELGSTGLAGGNVYLHFAHALFLPAQVCRTHPYANGDLCDRVLRRGFGSHLPGRKP